MKQLAKLFAENFDTLAQSPQGIKKMRQLILQLAVQGKLVPQDPKDEPASVLLEKIKNEKEKLIKEGKIKKQKPLPPIKDEEIPFALPNGWQWVRLDDITKKIGSGSTPRGGKSIYLDEGVRFLRSQNIYNDGLRLDNVVFIPPHIHEKMSGTVVISGDILLNITGASIARSSLVPDDFEESNVSQHVSIIRPIDKRIREYLHTCVISPYIYNLIMSVQVGMSREGLSKNRLKYFLIPLPPLAEQKRIVAKVDQLMALCDRLESQLNQARQRRRQLSDSTVHHLLTADNKKDFDKTFRLICDNFGLLYDNTENVENLRRAILQLAVQGKLVPQDPKDEPASVLLEKINNEKEKLIKQGKIKKQKPLPPIKDEEIPFALPNGWQWVRLGDLSHDIHYGYTASANPTKNDVRMLRITDIQDNKVNWLSVPGCIIKKDEVSKYKLFDGNILIARTGGTIGKSYLVDKISVCSVFASYLIRIIPSPEILSKFVKRFSESPLYWHQLHEKSMGTGQPNVNATSLKKLFFPLPPLAEQKRIVAKVDQLMALCDKLQEQIEQSRSRSEQLTESVVHHLLAG